MTVLVSISQAVYLRQEFSVLGRTFLTPRAQKMLFLPPQVGQLPGESPFISSGARPARGAGALAAPGAGADKGEPCFLHPYTQTRPHWPSAGRGEASAIQVGLPEAKPQEGGECVQAKARPQAT